MIIFGCFWQLNFQKIVMCQLLGWEFWAVQQDTLYFHQYYEHVNFYQKRVFKSLVGPSEKEMSQIKYNSLQIGTFQPKLDKV